MAVAADILGQLLHPAHIGIGLVLHDPPVRLQPPQQAIEQREPLGVGMEDGIARQRHEALARAHQPRIGGRDGHAPFAFRSRCGREQVAIAARLDPGDTIGRDPALHQRAGLLAPELEIVRFGQVHHIMAREPGLRERVHAGPFKPSPLRRQGPR